MLILILPAVVAFLVVAWIVGLNNHDLGMGNLGMGIFAGLGASIFVAAFGFFVVLLVGDLFFEPKVLVTEHRLAVLSADPTAEVPCIVNIETVNGELIYMYRLKGEIGYKTRATYDAKISEENRTDAVLVIKKEKTELKPFALILGEARPYEFHIPENSIQHKCLSKIS